jgi:tetratricopeptide (TPR) repeat protein
VLAHHYEAALELSRAAGAGRENEPRAQAVRYLGLAGERALSLDVDQAERELKRALSLCPADDPARAALLERWARAVQPQGRLQEARGGYEEALALNRRRGDPIETARVLTRLSVVLFRLGDPGSAEAITEAVELLEEQPPGPELVYTYSYQVPVGSRVIVTFPNR